MVEAVTQSPKYVPTYNDTQNQTEGKTKETKCLKTVLRNASSLARVPADRECPCANVKLNFNCTSHFMYFAVLTIAL